MADRRMFSRRIINSAKFLKMPVSTQCLYFHLGLNADDDGIVEAYMTMNMVGATEDDLKILVAKNFVQVLNEDLVTYITDWKENNKIRADRKVDSIYKDLLLQVNPEVQLLESKQRADRKKSESGTSHGQPKDNPWTDNGPHRTGQVRTGQVRLGKDNTIEYDLVVVDKIKSYFDLSEEELLKIHNAFKDTNKDINYLEEKLILTKNTDCKTVVGFLIEAIRRDYKPHKSNVTQFKPKVTNFHYNAGNEAFKQYSPDELEKMLKESQKGKF